MLIVLAFVIGILAGLRPFMAPAAVGFAARYCGPAVVELVGEQLPGTPSRRVPVQFGTRILMGALSGAAVGAIGGALAARLVAGIVGAVVGTFGGATARARLAAGFGRDLPAGPTEDVIAIGAALLIVCAAR